VDRNRQEWHKKDCEKLKLYDKDICSAEVGTPSTIDNSGTEEIVKSESRKKFLSLFVTLIINM
jgi:hypothetical protein